MSTTATQTLEEILARQVDRLNRHDAEAAASGYSPDAVVSDPWYPEPLRGREALARDFSEFFTAFPDFRINPTQVVSGDGVYAVEFKLTGTHKGAITTPNGHIPATGKPIDVFGAAFSTVDGDGRIARERRHYDVAAMLNQLGLVQ